MMLVVVVAAMLELLLLVSSSEASARTTEILTGLLSLRKWSNAGLPGDLRRPNGNEQVARCVPYPIDERQEILWITKGGSTSLSVISSTTATCGGVVTTIVLVSRESPDQAALRKYVQRDVPQFDLYWWNCW